MSAMSTKTAKAMASVSHLNARSPNWPVAVVIFVVAMPLKIFLRVKIKRTKSGRNALFALLTPHKISGGQTKSLFYCVEQLQFALLHVVRQRGVIQLRRQFLSVGHGPFQESHQRLAVVSNFCLLINQHPARAGNWIGFV